MACLERKGCLFQDRSRRGQDGGVPVQCNPDGESHLDFRHPEILLQGFYLSISSSVPRPRGVNLVFQ